MNDDMLKSYDIVLIKDVKDIEGFPSPGQRKGL